MTIRQPARVHQQPPGVALAGAVRVQVEVGRDVDVGQQPHAAGRRAGQHDRLGEHLRIGQPQLVGRVAAHRIARDHSAIGVGAELFGHPRPHFPHVEFALVEVPARRTPGQRRHHHRVPALADFVQQPRVDRGELALPQRK